MLGLVTLLLTAFGSGTPRTSAALSTTNASGVTGDTRPEPQVLATVGNMRLQQPVAQESVTGIGFRGSRDGALGLSPAGRQANEGLLLRLWHRIAGTPDGGLVWYQLSGSAGPGTTVLNVGAATGTDVYSPVDGTIAAISDFVIDGRALGARIDIRPQEAPAVFVSLIHLRPDPALTVGSPVRGGHLEDRHRRRRRLRGAAGARQARPRRREQRRRRGLSGGRNSPLAQGRNPLPRIPTAPTPCGRKAPLRGRGGSGGD